MSDLRDRIAAALKARDEAATDGISDPFLVEHASYDNLAEAVIAELGLREEDGIRPGFALKRAPRRYRYVTEWITDWKADDE